MPAAWKMFSNLCIKLFFIVAGTIVAGLLLELALRIGSLQPLGFSQEIQYVQDSRLAFRLAPNSTYKSSRWFSSGEYNYPVTTNALGFRDYEYQPQPDSNFIRILAVGDSFAAGLGARFEESYLTILEQRLNASHLFQLPVQIIKAGQPQYWTGPERILLEIYAPQFKPNLILVNFNPTDVIDECIGLKNIMIRNGNLVSHSVFKMGPIGFWAVKNLYLLQWLRQALVALSYHSTGSDCPWTEIFHEGSMLEPQWEAIERDLAGMLETAKSVGSKFAIVYTPTRELNAYPVQRLIRWGKRSGVPIIDTLSAIEAAISSGKKVFWRTDGHFNALGYQIIADEVFKSISHLQQSKCIVSSVDCDLTH